MKQRHSFLAPPKKIPTVLYYPSDLWKQLKCLTSKLFLLLRRKNNSQIANGISKAKDFLLLFLNLICRKTHYLMNSQCVNYAFTF